MLSLRKKLTIIYVAIILIPLLLINYWSISNVTQSVFHEVEVNALKTANIISNISKDNFEDVVALKRIVKQYVSPTGGRLLILDSRMNVIVDSFNQLDGDIIDNEEVRGALSNQEKIGYYQTYQRIMQVAVPVATTVAGERRVIGVVLTSSVVEDPFTQVMEFQRQILLISLVALIIGIFGALLASNQITRPIVVLSHAAKSIGEGKLGIQVSIDSNDEIGKLAEKFNLMSSELYRIDKGRTQFIGDVSHELRTPLASMKALIDSLLYGEDDIEVFREYLADMDEEIDRLSDLIKSLLTLTRLEEQGINAKSYSLKGLIDDSLKILKPLAEKYNTEIEIDIYEDILVICDINRMKEVFINLIDNAIKYSDPLKVKNKVCIYGKKEKEYYTLTIQDNGIGIPSEDIESVFEKFYRSDVSRSRDTGGAGIGLSIVNRIIKLHQWGIKIESRSGKGTSFFIEIPNSSFNQSS